MTDKILDIDDTSISKVLKRIEIGESTKTNPLQKLTEIVGNDQKVIDFFTDNRFDSFTDAVLKRIFQSDTHKSKETDKKFQNKLPIDVLGRYICYFNVKNVREEGPKHDSSSYGQVLNIVPLEIFEDKGCYKISISRN
ncbi:MAG: hypothetical protein R2822_16680 [Spirosomataceae bacterium]